MQNEIKHINSVRSLWENAGIWDTRIRPLTPAKLPPPLRWSVYCLLFFSLGIFCNWMRKCMSNNGVFFSLWKLSCYFSARLFGSILCLTQGMTFRLFSNYQPTTETIQTFSRAWSARPLRRSVSALPLLFQALWKTLFQLSLRKFQTPAEAKQGWCEPAKTEKRLLSLRSQAYDMGSSTNSIHMRWMMHSGPEMSASQHEPQRETCTMNPMQGSFLPDTRSSHREKRTYKYSNVGGTDGAKSGHDWAGVHARAAYGRGVDFQRVQPRSRTRDRSHELPHHRRRDDHPVQFWTTFLLDQWHFWSIALKYTQFFLCPFFLWNETTQVVPSGTNMDAINAMLASSAPNV